MKRGILAALCVALALAVLVGDAVAHVQRRRDVAPSSVEAALAAQGVEVARLRAGEGALGELRALGLGLVLAPGPARSPAELAAVASFVARGGRALVLGDADAALALDVSILPSRILDPDAASAREIHPVVDGREGARVLAATTNATFVDADGDGRATSRDVPGPFATLVAAPGGRVLVSGAAAWTPVEPRSALADLFPVGTRVIVESSATPMDAPAQALLDAATDPWVGGTVGLLVALAGVLAALRRQDA